MRRCLPARLLPWALLCFGAAVGLAQPAEADGVYPLLFSGKVLLADALRLELRHVGALSPGGRQLALDSSGRIWGRLGPKRLAALDPSQDRVVARIPLPRGPDGLLLTAEGKAYVTHASPARDGYQVSVVDMREQKLLRQFTGLAGRPVDLEQAGGFVYVAALGILKSDPLEAHLYRIEPGSDRLAEVLSSSDPGFAWELAAAGGRLYLGFLPLGGEPRPGRVEVRDARTLDLLQARQDLPGALRGLHAEEGRVLLFCADGKEGTLLLVLDPLLGGPVRKLALEGPFSRVLGVHGDLLVYLDYPAQAAAGKVNVRFYDLEAGRERKRINVRSTLSRQGDIHAYEKADQ